MKENQSVMTMYTETRNIASNHSLLLKYLDPYPADVQSVPEREIIQAKDEAFKRVTDVLLSKKDPIGVCCGRSGVFKLEDFLPITYPIPYSWCRSRQDDCEYERPCECHV